MSRFYFDVLDNGRWSRDEQGLEYPDIGAAIAEARRAAAEISKQSILEEETGPVRVAVRDHKNGPVLFTVSWSLESGNT